MGSAAISLSYSLLAELLSAPCHDRGLMLVGPFWGLGSVICDKVAGALVQKTDGSAPRWREFLALMVVPIFLLLLWVNARLPETPVWKQAQEERRGATACATATLSVALLAAPVASHSDDDDVGVTPRASESDSFRSESRAITAASPWAQARLLLFGALAFVTWSVCLVWGFVFGAFGTTYTSCSWESGQASTTPPW